MRKAISILLIFCLLISLVACSNQTANTEPNEPTDDFYYENENIAINDYRDTVFDFYQFEVTDEDLELYVNYHILMPNATYTEVKEGTVADEDYIHIFVTTKNEEGEIIEQYTTGEAGYFLYVGLGDYMDGLDEQVVGMSVGETATFDNVLTINNTETPVTVEVSIDYIQLTELPEATDELAQQAGYESLEAFKEEYTAQLEEEYASDAYSIFIESVKEKVIAEVYNYPEELIESYVTKYKESLFFYSAMYDMTEEEYLESFSKMTYEDWIAQVEEQAKKDVETELMLTAILEANNLTLDEDAYDYYLDLMAQQSGYANGEALELAMETQGVSSDLTRELTMNYGYDILLLTAKMRLVNWSTGEVIVDYVESTDSAT